METSATENKLRETWDRLVLLLIAQPREGWEPEFEQITRREIERLAASVEGGESVMDSAPRTAYQPNPSVTPEEARDVRARVWRFVFDCYAKKKGGVPSTADDAKERSKSEFRAKSIISE